MPKARNLPKKLLVEGKDDQHVLMALCKRFEIPENFEIIDSKGIDNLLLQLPERFKESDVTTVGVIVDADTDLAGRWLSIRSILVANGYDVPEQLPAQGLVISHIEKPSVGVWLMPDNATNGMLEDFLRFLVPEDDSLLPVIQTNLQNIEDQHLNRYTPAHKSKAVIHSWLAVQENPGTPMGLSITKRYLTTNHDNCSQLIHWIRNTFDS